MHRLIMVLGALILATEGSAKPMTQFIAVNYFAGDDRVDVDSNSSPYNAIGKLLSKVSSCSSFVAVNPRIVVSNAHCVVVHGLITAESIYFYPSYSYGKFAQRVRARVYAVRTRKPEDEVNNDCAVLLLDEPIYDVNPFGITTPGYDPTTSGLRFVLAGYSRDKHQGEKLTADLSCGLEREMVEGVISHHCHMSVGASGAPIFYPPTAGTNATVVAIQSRETGISKDDQGKNKTKGNENYAVHVACFRDEVFELREKIKNSRNIPTL